MWGKVWDDRLYRRSQDGREGEFTKRRVFGTAALLLMILIFSGCGTVGDKDSSLSIIYGATAALSLLLLIGYCCLVHKKGGKRAGMALAKFCGVKR